MDLTASENNPCIPLQAPPSFWVSARTSSIPSWGKITKTPGTNGSISFGNPFTLRSCRTTRNGKWRTCQRSGNSPIIGWVPLKRLVKPTYFKNDSVVPWAHNFWSHWLLRLGLPVSPSVVESSVRRASWILLSTVRLEFHCPPCVVHFLCPPCVVGSSVHRDSWVLLSIVRRGFFCPPCAVDSSVNYLIEISKAHCFHIGVRR